MQTEKTEYKSFIHPFSTEPDFYSIKLFKRQRKIVNFFKKYVVWYLVIQLIIVMALSVMGSGWLFELSPEQKVLCLSLRNNLPVVFSLVVFALVLVMKQGKYDMFTFKDNMRQYEKILLAEKSALMFPFVADFLGEQYLGRNMRFIFGRACFNVEVDIPIEYPLQFRLNKKDLSKYRTTNSPFYRLNLYENTIRMERINPNAWDS